MCRAGLAMAKQASAERRTRRSRLVLSASQTEVWRRARIRTKALASGLADLGLTPENTARQPHTYTHPSPTALRASSLDW
jgi:hypothetical protein